MKTFLFFISFVLTVLGTSTASGNVSEEGVNVAEELFHRRFTIGEDFESKNAVIEVHLTSIDMLVSVTVNSVNRKISSFTTAYLPGKTFTNETEMDEEQQIDMADRNQPPRTTKAIQRDEAGNNSTWLAPAWNSFLNAVKSVLKWLYIGIEWPNDINSDAFARMTVTASDSTCPADGIVNYSMFMDMTDKDQTTCPVASSIQLMTLIHSKSDSKSLSNKSEDGKVNTTLPATSLENRETNVTASPGKAEREVNEIKENKRREQIVIFMGHSDSGELSKDESSELPKFTSSRFSGLHPEIRLSNRQENDDVMFRGDSDSDHDTVTSLDREEDEFSPPLETYFTEKTHPKENGLALPWQQKDTEIGTFALLDEPQSTLKNETLSDLVDKTNQTTTRSEKAYERSENVKMVIGTLISSNEDQTDASPLKKVYSGVCRIEEEHLDGHINDLPSLTTPYQDISFLRGSIAKKSQSRWMTKQVIDEAVVCLTGLNQSGPESKRCIRKAVRRLTETYSLPTRIWNRCADIVGCGMKSSAVSLQAITMMRKQDKWAAQASPVNVSRMCLKASKPTGPEICAKESSPLVDSSWFIARLWNRGLVSVGLRKPNIVSRKTAKRPQYQRLPDVPVNVFEICMSEINQTGPETSFCTTKAARRLAESQWFTTKLWNKGVASMRWIRSNETQEKARNLTNLYLTRVVTTMINWTWQDTFDVMTTILVTDYCFTALYLAIPHIINIITWLIRMLIRKWRLYRENQQRKLEEERERLRQEELARERAAQPKPWRPKQPRKRKANFCGRLQKW